MNVDHKQEDTSKGGRPPTPELDFYRSLFWAHFAMHSLQITSWYALAKKLDINYSEIKKIKRGERSADKFYKSRREHCPAAAEVYEIGPRGVGLWSLIKGPGDIIAVEGQLSVPDQHPNTGLWTELCSIFLDWRRLSFLQLSQPIRQSLGLSRDQIDTKCQEALDMAICRLAWAGELEPFGVSPGFLYFLLENALYSAGGDNVTDPAYSEQEIASSILSHQLRLIFLIENRADSQALAD